MLPNKYNKSKYLIKESELWRYFAYVRVSFYIELEMSKGTNHSEDSTIWPSGTIDNTRSKIKKNVINKIKEYSIRYTLIFGSTRILELNKKLPSL